ETPGSAHAGSTECADRDEGVLDRLEMLAFDRRYTDLHLQIQTAEEHLEGCPLRHRRRELCSNPAPGFDFYFIWLCQPLSVFIGPHLQVHRRRGSEGSRLHNGHKSTKHADGPGVMLRYLISKPAASA
ncbi:hypothetical protein IRJ41_019548, partial [Triplophysa rosa]